MPEISGLGLGVALGGGLLVYAGLKDFGVLDGLRAIVSGKSPTTAAKPHVSQFQDLSARIDALLGGSGGDPGAGQGGGLLLGPQAAIANAALQYVGAPYRYGGADPNGGFDCSGLIQYVLAHDLSMRGVPRTIGELNIWPGAVNIGASQAQAGDLVLWPYGLGPDAHGGIVTIPGQYVNAPHAGQKVRVDPIPASLHGGPPVYRRVLNVPGGRLGLNVPGVA